MLAHEHLTTRLVGQLNDPQRFRQALGDRLLNQDVDGPSRTSLGNGRVRSGGSGDDHPLGTPLFQESLNISVERSVESLRDRPAPLVCIANPYE